MKNFIKVFSHIIVWTIVLIVPMLFMIKEGSFETKPYLTYVIRIAAFAFLFYINYLYLIDKFLFSKKFVLYVLINVILVLLMVMIQNYVTDLLKPPMADMFERIPPMERVRHRGPGGPPMVMRLIIEYVSMLFVIGLSVTIKTTIRWYRDSITFEKAKSIQLEADLRNLRSQLNPHFLFNTLNNIYSLIAVDQTGAQDAVHRLSNLLRYVMYDNNEKFVPMDKELEFTRNYIDLMKLRLSPNVKLNVLIESKGSTDLIASLMFMTLIENAFKHGINNGENSFIDIDILVDPGKGVLCTVENSLFEKENNMEERIGIGMNNLQKRLDLLYPDKYEFIAEKRTDSFFTLLRIDFSKQNVLS